MSEQEDLNELMGRMETCLNEHCPKWLTPNSTYVGIMPGHSLDLLQIAFDLKVDRTHMLLSETPVFLKDPSKPDLNLVRGKNES